MRRSALASAAAIACALILTACSPPADADAACTDYITDQQPELARSEVAAACADQVQQGTHTFDDIVIDDETFTRCVDDLSADDPPMGSPAEVAVLCLTSSQEDPDRFAEIFGD